MPSYKTPLTFPTPGDALRRTWVGDDGLHVVASDHYTDDVAVVLVTYPSVPHFRIFLIDLEQHRGEPCSERMHNIGTAVAEYNQCGGTVNDIDPWPVQGIEIERLPR